MVKAKCWTLGVLLAGLIAGCDNSETRLSISYNTETPPSFLTQQADQFFVDHGAIRMGLKPLSGGRIASLKYNDHELLQTHDPYHNILWGSVLWSSPQSEWGWPPIEVLDSKPYRVTVEDEAVVFTSKVDPKTGYQFVKKHSVVPGSEALRILYSIHNYSQESKTVAPWEVTRFKTGGLTLFPKGKGSFESGIFYLLPVEERDDIVWHQYNTDKLHKDHHKLMADGSEGWLAYVNEGYLIIKQFEDVPTGQIVPGEGEIELFANAERTCMEHEQQGPLARLKAGEHLDWEVIWHIKKVPAGLNVEVGSQELVALIRETVASTPFSPH